MGRPVGRDVDGGFVWVAAPWTNGYCSDPPTSGTNGAPLAPKTTAGASAETPTGRQSVTAARDIPRVDNPNEITAAAKTVQRATVSHSEPGNRGQGAPVPPKVRVCSIASPHRSTAAPPRVFLADRVAW